MPIARLGAPVLPGFPVDLELEGPVQRRALGDLVPDAVGRDGNDVGGLAGQRVAGGTGAVRAGDRPTLERAGVGSISREWLQLIPDAISSRSVATSRSAKSTGWPSESRGIEILLEDREQLLSGNAGLLVDQLADSFEGVTTGVGDRREVELLVGWLELVEELFEDSHPTDDARR
jgi:hypothetical protein